MMARREKDRKWREANPEYASKASRAWRERNPERAAAYDTDGKAGKRESHLRRKFGITSADVEAMAARQRGECACCASPLPPRTGKGRGYRVDHNHATGKVRGLLCRQCNVSLGLLKENPATLYQMAAYLELDRTRPVVYLVGSLRNPQVPSLAADIRALGIECVDNWYAAGERADDSWQAYSNARGRTYQEALNSREAKHVFHFDRAYLNLADAVVLLYPAGRSGHLEFGYAIGQGKKGFMLMEEPAERYDVMLQFAGAPLFHDRPTLLAAVQESLLGAHA